MTLEIGTLPPSFVGPSAFLLGILLILVLVVVIVRFVVGLAWKLVVVSIIVLAVLWLLGVGPPVLG